MESQRAIMEAESINRLTELAFLFIPLSFAAALFSMQVRELSTSPPVAYFVAFALPLSATTYALRAVARSAWLQETKQALLTNIRTFKSLPPGARIPNLAILAWLFDHLVIILTEPIFQVRYGQFGMNTRLANYLACWAIHSLWR
ncbi:hypothetical protein BJY01DRAFT_150480 [Aspergillus pseudoustus]|uniref:Uncharacterized protein n=1 Tax=Aspergillus pseudoustus TaxID=1810923 RepID=A0ABR4IEL7_9EURO